MPVEIRIAAEGDAGALAEIYAPFVRDSAVSFEEVQKTAECADAIVAGLRLVRLDGSCGAAGDRASEE